jgi:flagellar motor switch protein FliM
MAEELDQNAINNLFRAGATVDEPPTPINFAKLGSISPEQMQMLISVNQVFSQNLGMTLSARLGAPINLTMVAAERSLYHKLVDTIDFETSYLAQSRFKSPDARSLLTMDLGLVEPLVHLALGGLTTIPKVSAQRELTQIDVAILEILMNAFSTEMNAMWAQFGLQASYESRVVPVHAKRFFPPAEYVLSFTYEMQVGDRQGSLQVILATVIASALLREVDIRDNDRTQPPATRRLLQERLGSLGVRTTLRLPPFKVLASEIVSLREGDLLESSLPTSTSCLLGMADGPLWEAVPMLSDERIAAKLLRPQAESLPKR